MVARDKGDYLFIEDENCGIKVSKTINLLKQLKELKLLNFCSNCFSMLNLKTCSRCKAIYYCSRECQKNNWSIHKRRKPRSIKEKIEFEKKKGWLVRFKQLDIFQEKHWRSFERKEKAKKRRNKRLENSEADKRSNFKELKKDLYIQDFIIQQD